LANTSLPYLSEACEATSTPFSQVIVLTGREVLLAKTFNALLAAGEEEGALLVGVDPKNLSTTDPEYLNKIKDILILDMLTIALSLARDKSYTPRHKYITVNPLAIDGRDVDRCFEFIPDIPDAEAVDYKILRNKYRLEYEVIGRYV